MGAAGVPGQAGAAVRGADGAQGGADWGAAYGLLSLGSCVPLGWRQRGSGFWFHDGKEFVQECIWRKSSNCGSNCAEVISQLLVQSSARRWCSVVGFIVKMLKQFISETLFYGSQSCFTSPVLVAFTCLKWLS